MIKFSDFRSEISQKAARRQGRRRPGGRPDAASASTATPAVETGIPSPVPDAPTRLTALAVGSLCVLLAGRPAVASAPDMIYRDPVYGVSAAVPAGLRICAPLTADAGHGLDILLGDAGTCEAGVPKRVMTVDAQPNAIGAAGPAGLEQFYCRDGAPLPVPLIVARALRPGDDACSALTRTRRIAVWVLRQRAGINYEIGLASDLRHYARDLLAFRTLLLRIRTGTPR